MAGSSIFDFFTFRCLAQVCRLTELRGLAQLWSLCVGDVIYQRVVEMGRSEMRLPRGDRIRFLPSDFVVPEWEQVNQ